MWSGVLPLLFNQSVPGKKLEFLQCFLCLSATKWVAATWSKKPHQGLRRFPRVKLNWQMERNGAMLAANGAQWWLHHNHLTTFFCVCCPYSFLVWQWNLLVVASIYFTSLRLDSFRFYSQPMRVCVLRTHFFLLYPVDKKTYFYVFHFLSLIWFWPFPFSRKLLHWEWRNALFIMWT